MISALLLSEREIGVQCRVGEPAVMSIAPCDRGEHDKRDNLHSTNH